MLRLVALASCAALAGATRADSQSSELSRAQVSEHRGCVDVNSATYLELRRTGLMSRGMALRVVMARTCPFKDVEAMKAKLIEQGKQQLWEAVSPLLQSNKLCVGCSQVGETKSGTTLDLLKTPITDLMSQIGMDEGLARNLNKAMECKFTSFDDFKSRLEGPTYSGLEGGSVEFKADRTWFTSGALCDFAPAATAVKPSSPSPSPSPSPLVVKNSATLVAKKDDSVVAPEERAEKAPIDQTGCVNVNTCTYLELKNAGIMSRGLALRILTARRCPFKDTAEMNTKVSAVRGGDKVLAAFEPLLASGKLCVGKDCSGSAMDIDKVPISDLVNKAGIDEALGRTANLAMECKFTSFGDFKGRVEGPSFSGLDGGNVEFKVDQAWFDTGKLCRL